MGAPVLVGRNISKSYGRLNVIESLNITLERGDVYFLFGSNGAGKTTLAKILSSLISPDTGELSLFGRDTDDSPKEIKRNIGFMSHEGYLYGELSAWENLTFYSQLYDVQDRKARMIHLLKEVGLHHRAYDRVRGFSRGMKQRLALARTLLHDPELIFLDEAYAGLDIKARKVLDKMIRRWKKRKKTLFFITHDAEIGLVTGNKWGILSGGRIVYEAEEGEEKIFLKKYRKTIWGEGR